MKLAVGISVTFLVAFAFQAPQSDATRVKRALFRGNNRLTSEGEFFVLALTTWDKFDHRGRLKRFNTVERDGPKKNRIAKWDYVINGGSDLSRGYTWAVGQVKDMIRTRNIPQNDVRNMLNKAKEIVAVRQAALVKHKGGDQGHNHAKREWDSVVEVIEAKVRGRDSRRLG